MNDLQSKLLEILKWYHNFCVEHNLRYFLIGGTLLGAVRHKGFIPWDDDIDVGMPREDYMKFIEITKNLVDERFTVESPYKCEKDYLYCFAKVYDKKTTLVEDAKKPIVRGIYIDVFPFDNVGDNIEEARKFSGKVFKKINIFLAKKCAIRKGRKWYKNLAVFLMKCIPYFGKARLKDILKIEKQATSKKNQTKYVANLYGAWQMKEISESSFVYESNLSNEGDFEGNIFYIVDKPNNYLSGVYGDYMKLPPIEKQKSHHAFIYLNLDLPFKNYKK